jgi:hypothetical protein
MAASFELVALRSQLLDQRNQVRILLLERQDQVHERSVIELHYFSALSHARYQKPASCR